jgi:alkanesulfonate monooxygenase SsuD/methylene tetrahydromethanopterin reductase-like flavin-dependent oxidoreductase (luciferase family)
MPGKLTFGYVYDLRNPAQWQRRWEDVYAETLDFAVWSESAGYEGAWVPEHHLAADGYVPTPQVVLGALAARTSRMKLGSGVVLAPLHHPVRFAEECAVLDIIARGRLEMQLAIGYRRLETGMFGVDFTKRGRMFDEFLEIVTRLWAGEEVTFAGQFYQVRGARLSPPAPRLRIPLHIGGFTDKAIARSIKYADGYSGTVEGAELYLAKLREAGRDAANPSLRVVMQYFAVAEDPARALAILAPYYLHVYNSYADWIAEDEAVGVAEEFTFRKVTLDQFIARGMFKVLTPAEAVAMLRELQARIPVEHVMMTLPPGIPAEEFRPYADLFAREVIPAFA